MKVYYNEIDAYCANWLRNLMLEGLIPAGDVDTRSIVDVEADDLKGYTQCHFFAGLGGWAYAMRLAGWPDEREVWTGSCPCQPFSVAGKQKGIEDERHLWPVWFNLIRECRPSVVFGEQVASAKIWLDGVYADMEAAAYAVGSTVLPACVVNAPHKRDRLWFVADRDSRRTNPRGGATLKKCLAFRKVRANQNTVPLYLAETVNLHCGAVPTSVKTEGGAYSDPVKARARMMSGHQVNLEDQVLASGLLPTAMHIPAQEHPGVMGGANLQTVVHATSARQRARETGALAPVRIKTRSRELER